MLITVPEAIARYETTRSAVVSALARRTITRHERDGVVVVDTDELDQQFTIVQPLEEAEPAPPVRQPDERPRMVVPHPDELDAAVRRAIGR